MVNDDLEKAIGRVALGDRAAFRALYAATSAKLFGICLRVMRNRSDAEDVLQETFVKIWHNAGRFRAEGTSPIAWLAAIARHQAIDRLRARRPETVEIDEAHEIADDAISPEGELLATVDAVRIKQCLGELKPDRAEAVKAAYVDGFSYQELAERHGLPLNTVRTWLRRSLLTLRECLSR
jgi:RNA polymerase sigma-70 factor, ECF subfamily